MMGSFRAAAYGGSNVSRVVDSWRRTVTQLRVKIVTEEKKNLWV